MTSDVLQQVRDLQFIDKPRAEQLLLSFMTQDLGLEVRELRLTPKPTSLNSFNGILVLNDGQQRFFKTHTESHTIIQEYYNSELLASVGYPIIQPIFQSSQAGKQILLYEVVENPSVFELSWDLENQKSSLSEFSLLKQAQEQADLLLFSLYTKSLKFYTSIELSPIHQLFYHRLTGGRLDLFYTGKDISLPGGTYSMRDVGRWKWVINGQYYQETLSDLIQRATTTLQPEKDGLGIIGHGDAHNGNIFFIDKESPTLVYFDPAFAGYHHPILDLVKPLFHNVFAMWMYYPVEKSQTTIISLNVLKGTAYVDYEYILHDVRQMFLKSKVINTLIPTLKHLKNQNLLRDDWRSFMKYALFCCPFLTMNLANPQKFPPSIALLGLAMSIEMGLESNGSRSVIDTVLDEISAHL